MEMKMGIKEDWVVVHGVDGVEDGCYRCQQRYPDGDVRVSVDFAGGGARPQRGQSVVVPSGSWTETEE